MTRVDDHIALRENIFRGDLVVEPDGNIFLLENAVERIGAANLLEPIILRRQLATRRNPRGVEIAVLFGEDVRRFRAVLIDVCGAVGAGRSNYFFGR